MGRKKRPSAIFTEADQEKNCMDFLRERGYAIFRAESPSQVEEEEAVRKLRAVGYRVEHIRDSLVKVDPTKIRTVDDIAVYFHEMMSRHNNKRHNKNRLKDKSLRIVDHSIINSFIGWRIDEGSSVTDALEDMFLLVDVLFEKSGPWNIDIRGMGILSVNSNKPFVLSLMREAKLKKDVRLEFEMDQLVKRDVEANYLQVLEESKVRMDEVGPSIRPLKKTRRKLQERK
jgi:hypothetical protein